MGGGTTEVAIISLGGVVVGKSLRVGGDEMNQAIIRFMKRKYNLEVGDRTAEQAKFMSAIQPTQIPRINLLLEAETWQQACPIV